MRNDFDKLLETNMQDPEFNQEYDALAPEYTAIEASIKMEKMLRRYSATVPLNPDYLKGFSYETFEIQESQLLGDGVNAPSKFVLSGTKEGQTFWSSDIPEVDRWDYLAATASGTLAAALDIFWVGEFSLLDAQNFGKKEADRFVIKMANAQGYKGDDLAGAIRTLEKKFKLPSDGATSDFGGGKQHHLRDFAHHPDVFGVIFSLVAQFTGYAYGTDTAGDFISVEVKDFDGIGENFWYKIFNGIVIWAMHLVSDMAGSSQNAGAGTGIPGMVLSLMKTISAIPGVNNIKVLHEDNPIEFSKVLSKLFNGTYLSEDGVDIRFDLRTEIGMLHELSRQAIPVIVNECVVRAIYSVRRLVEEVEANNVHTLQDLKKINPREILPYNTRRLVRMLTVSSGVFMAIEVSGAAMGALLKSKGNGTAFAKTFLLSVNYVGIGRFVFACTADAKYIAEDFKIAYENFREQYEEKKTTTAQASIAIEQLMLSPKQTQLLYSLKLQKVQYDILQSKSGADMMQKQSWCDRWYAETLAGLQQTSDWLLQDEALLYQALQIEIENNKTDHWMFLLAMELCAFVPYHMLAEVKDIENKAFKKLKYSSHYGKEIFAKTQGVIDVTAYDGLSKAYRKSANTLNNGTQKIAIGVATTVVVTATTGGLAYIFAPQIAVALLGGSFATLHGAALTSATLAAIGGGALTAGGLDMAGGVAIIAGGGALLGVAGGSATTVATTMLLSSKGYVLSECQKLLTYCDFVLAKRYQQREVVAQIQEALHETIATLEQTVSEADTNQKDFDKNKKASLQCLRKCERELVKLSEKGSVS